VWAAHSGNIATALNSGLRAGRSPRCIDQWARAQAHGQNTLIHLVKQELLAAPWYPEHSIFPGLTSDGTLCERSFLISPLGPAQHTAYRMDLEECYGDTMPLGWLEV